VVLTTWIASKPEKQVCVDFCQNMHFDTFEHVSMLLALARANLISAVACDSLGLHTVVCGRLQSAAIV